VIELKHDKSGMPSIITKPPINCLFFQRTLLFLVVHGDHTTTNISFVMKHNIGKKIISSGILLQMNMVKCKWRGNGKA
jgi:hypothetical protein